MLFFVANAQPYPKREFRGAWITTVNQLDWPSVAGSSAQTQREELIRKLDHLERLNFNAVIFQVRPASDAFYRSATELWSYWLTGEQGKAPDQDWDPLAFVVEEAHKRGMELHAWFNPFRISQNNNIALSENNIALKSPEWVVDYDNKKFLDPGIPAVRDHLNKIVAEVVSNYNIDAVHFDDYFYPYPSGSKNFPDTASFRQFNRGYDSSQIANWRRENVDLIIESLNRTIKKIKPQVKFGISPFGVWRNQADDPLGSATTAGITNYDHLFADVIKWQKNGWIDYLLPQLYWEFNHPAADFATLCQWWEKHAYGRHVYIGHAAYKAVEAAGNAWRNPNELPDQIKLTRKLKGISGSAYFRMQHIELNPNGFADSLANNFYQKKALLPTMPWLDRRPPNPPSQVKARRGVLSWNYSKKTPISDDHAGYLIYYSPNKNTVNRNNHQFLIGFTVNDSFELHQLPEFKQEEIYLWVTAIDKHHNESRPVGPVKIKLKHD